MIKCGVVFAQTNAESERSLSINAQVVTSERSAVGEEKITGLHTVKAVRFSDQVIINNNKSIYIAPILSSAKRFTMWLKSKSLKIITYICT